MLISLQALMARMSSIVWELGEVPSLGNHSESEPQTPKVLSVLCHVQDNFLQVMDHVAKLFASPQGLSAAIYTQVSDIEAEVNGESALYLPALSVCTANLPLGPTEGEQSKIILFLREVLIGVLIECPRLLCFCLCRSHDLRQEGEPSTFKTCNRASLPCEGCLKACRPQHLTECTVYLPSMQHVPYWHCPTLLCCAWLGCWSSRRQC